MTSPAAQCAGCGKTAAQVKKLQAGRAGSFICNSCVMECSAAMADSPTRIPGKSRHCSFCDRTEGSVAVLLVLGNELICDECVDHHRAAL
jgi:ATP-dependent protease Clp ATPase subunit